MTATNTVWVVDDERSIRWVLDKALTQAELNVTCFEDGQSLLNKLEVEQPDAVVSDIRMPGIDGLDLLQRIKTAWPDLPVVIMTAHSDLDSAVASIQGGAFEYLPKPFEVDEAVAIVQRAIRQAQEKKPTEKPEAIISSEIIGKHPPCRKSFGR